MKKDHADDMKHLQKTVSSLEEEIENLSEVKSAKPKKRRLGSLRNLEPTFTNKSVQVETDEIK